MQNGDIQLEPRPGEPDETLVAYLDGELSESEVQAVESRLGHDAQYRQSLAQLDRTWDCLDELPVTMVDESFTRSTVEMVAVAAEQEIAATQALQPVVRRKRRFAVGGVFLAAMLTGFVAAAVFWPNPDDALTRDLPVLAAFDAYQHVDDVAFLQRLHREQVFGPLEHDLAISDADGSEPTDSEPALGGSLAAALSPVLGREASSAERRAAVAALAADDLAQLQAVQERFRRLSDQQQAQLREVHQAIENDAKPADLRRTLAHYQDWLAQLSPGQRNDMLALSHDERIAAINKHVSQTVSQRARQLSAEDRLVLLRWVREFLLAHRSELLERMPPDRRGWFEKRMRESTPQQQVGMLMMIGVGWDRGGEQRDPLPPPREDDLQKLRGGLSPIARERLQQAGSRDGQLALLKGWLDLAVRDYMQARFKSSRRLPTVSEQELEEFFATGLTSEERSRLLSLPTQEEMQRELRNLYFRGSPSDEPRDRPGPPEVRPGDRPTGRPPREHDGHGPPRGPHRGGLGRGGPVPEGPPPGP